jgi:multiple sugar transport system ATP-binding protein
MVFQNYALFPHLTAYENIGFGLSVTGTAKATLDKKVREAAKLLQLEHLLERKPKLLSGGQRQRVAIGRAIVREPGVFLFDEPLSNLDAALRGQTRLEIAKLHRDYGRASTVYVTHDQVEAMTLADRILLLNTGEAVLKEGSIAQFGSPMELYHRPRTLFVAGFIGSPKMNLMAATVDRADAQGVAVSLQGGRRIEVAVDGSRLQAGQGVTLGLRAEHVLAGRAGSQHFAGQVHMVEHLGEANFLYVTLDNGTDVVVRGDGSQPVAIGTTLDFSAHPAAFHLFDAQGQALRRLMPGNMVTASQAAVLGAAA